jgi:hypothetical protein
VPTAVGIAVFIGCFLRIRQRWFIEGLAGFGYTTWVAQTTIDGTAIAPDQYRPLMPWVDHHHAREQGVVQLPFNLTPGVLAMVMTFYGALLLAPALLAPALFAARNWAVPPLTFVVAWFLIEFAATFVVGRVEESRIFMPFAPALGVAALMAYRQLAGQQAALVAARGAEGP